MNKSNKTLLQILTEELPKRGGWPKFPLEMQAVQDNDGEIKFHFLGHPLEFELNNPGNWGSNTPDAWLEKFESCSNVCAERSIDYATAIITRDQYESALADTATTDGWIEWAGGECPVDGAAFVDYKMRSGQVDTEDAHILRWNHKGFLGDIIAYRLHHPQDANSRANDNRLAQDAAFEGVSLRHRRDGFKTPPAKQQEETDLNDCIGQAPEPVYSGYGVPPLGAAIEWREGRRWYPGTVTAIGEQLIIIKDQHGEEGSYSLEHTDFRRDNFEIDELAAVIDASDEGGDLSPSQQQSIAKHLISVGYRKQ